MKALRQYFAQSLFFPITPPPRPNKPLPYGRNMGIIIGSGVCYSRLLCHCRASSSGFLGQLQWPRMKTGAVRVGQSSRVSVCTITANEMKGARTLCRAVAYCTFPLDLFLKLQHEFSWLFFCILNISEYICTCVATVRVVRTALMNWWFRLPWTLKGPTVCPIVHPVDFHHNTQTKQSYRTSRWATWLDLFIACKAPPEDSELIHSWKGPSH